MFIFLPDICSQVSRWRGVHPTIIPFIKRIKLNRHIFYCQYQILLQFELFSSIKCVIAMQFYPVFVPTIGWFVSERRWIETLVHKQKGTQSPTNQVPDYTIVFKSILTPVVGLKWKSRSCRWILLISRCFFRKSQKNKTIYYGWFSMIFWTQFPNNVSKYIQQQNQTQPLLYHQSVASLIFTLANLSSAVTPRWFCYICIDPNIILQQPIKSCLSDRYKVGVRPIELLPLPDGY